MLLPLLLLNSIDLSFSNVANFPIWHFRSASQFGSSEWFTETFLMIYGWLRALYMCVYYMDLLHWVCWQWWFSWKVVIFFQPDSTSHYRLYFPQRFYIISADWFHIRILLIQWNILNFKLWNALGQLYMCRLHQSNQKIYARFKYFELFRFDTHLSAA